MIKAVFKPYQPNQSYLIPPSWEEKIAEAHPVRVVSKIIDSLDLRLLYSSYEGGGSSSYDPKMLLKGLVYCYMINIYSSRKIEEAIKSNIYLIWLCGGNEPDHNTINRFRVSKLESFLKDIFKQIVLLLESESILSLKTIYVDGTKIEANANRYTFVWGKTIKRNKENISKQIDSLWEYTLKVAGEELSDTSPINYHQVDSKKLEETITRIETALKGKEVPQEIKKKISYAKKKYPSKLEEYEKQEEILKGRNSYSKTDTDATFMRTKEDHLGNGQLKPAYNVQISTNNQIITNYDIYPNPGDTLTLPSHLDNFQALYGQRPEQVVADSGYGSEQNYEYLEQNNIKSYVKYNTFHQEENGTRQKKHPFAQEYLAYNSKDDYYTCPMGQRMSNIGIKQQQNESGFIQTITEYRAQNCKGCPMRSMCFKGKGNRVIEVNYNLNRHKKNARVNLCSEEGYYHRRKRGVDVEPVFGNLKHNKNFKRFSLRGNNKVKTEFGLFAIAHNLRKKVA